MSWYYSAIGSKSLEKRKFPSIKDSESAKRAPTIIKISWLNQRWCHWWWIDLWTCPSITRIDQNATRMLHMPNCIMANLPVKERQAISLRTYLAKACERFTIVTSVPKWQEPSPFYSTKDCPNCSIWVQPAHTFWSQSPNLTKWWMRQGKGLRADMDWCSSWPCRHKWIILCKYISAIIHKPTKNSLGITMCIHSLSLHVPAIISDGNYQFHSISWKSLQR